MSETSGARAPSAPWPNAVLVGTRASGKSRAARRLAETTGWTRVSTDERFETRYGPISDFVRERGWARFRDLESEILRRISGDRLIVDCGGGIVESPANRALLRALGTVYWIRAPLAVVRERLSRPRQAGRRPPLLPAAQLGPESAPTGSGPASANEAGAVLARRAPLYRAVSEADVWSAPPAPVAGAGAPAAIRGETPEPALTNSREAADALRVRHFGPAVALVVSPKTPEAAVADLLRTADEAGPHDLLELRADALGLDAASAPQEALASILARLPDAIRRRLIVTIRRRADGGVFLGRESERDRADRGGGARRRRVGGSGVRR